MSCVPAIYIMPFHKKNRRFEHSLDGTYQLDGVAPVAEVVLVDLHVLHFLPDGLHDDESPAWMTIKCVRLCRTGEISKLAPQDFSVFHLVFICTPFQRKEKTD